MEFSLITKLVAGLIIIDVVFSSNFSQAYLAVIFRPYVSITDVSKDAYTESDLIPIVSKFASKFHQVFTQYEYDESTLTDCTWTSASRAISSSSWKCIPTAVAKFNLLQRKHEKPLEVIMSYTGNDADQVSIENALLRTKGQADRANSIFPGSVKTIIWMTSKLSQHHIAHLKYANQILKKDDAYKFGVSCSWKADEAADIAETLHFLDIILYQIMYYAGSPKVPQQIIETEISVYRSIRIFENFLKRIKADKLSGSNPFKNLTTGIHTCYPDTLPDGTQNYSNLVLFWEAMNDWTSKNKHLVVIHEAFDNANQAGYGWWKLIENSSYENTSDYVFIEKKSLVKMESKPSEGYTSSDAFKDDWKYNLSTTTVITLLTSFFLFALLVVGGIILLNKRLQRKMKTFIKDELPNSDLREFFTGESSSSGSEQGDLGNNATANLPYDAELEVERQSFSLDEDCPLGIGQFGQVHRGSLTKNNVEMTVAIKTTRPSCPSTALKGLLSEIKVLSYLGEHENIVNILGAYTADLAKGKVFVLLELCSHGSLEKYLRSLDQQVITARPNEDSVQEEQSTNSEMEYYSRRWAHQITCGMEYIASKNVVHADLATRNILLTEHKTAKICDFGLSRRMYAYQSYMKSKQEPLPWRWMSPESLRRWEFNEKTDVWSFGVTLWEIYSRGDLPYAGLSWSPGFPERLKSGLRLEQPSYCSPVIYSRMLQCWNLDQSQRPTFSSLKMLLANELATSYLSLTEIGNDSILEDAKISR